jgi:hypothetical protein
VASASPLSPEHPGSAAPVAFGAALDPAGADQPDHAGLLQHLEMVADIALQLTQGLGELADGRGPLEQ